MDALTILLAVLGFSLLGTILGAAAGLVPGLHINNVAYLLGASAGSLAGLAAGLFPMAGPEEALLLVGAMLVSCLMAHAFTSIIPSVFLGAPDPGRALSVLPAHRLLVQGKGVEAVRCSLVGCVGGLAACLLALPLFRVIMGDPINAYEKLRPFMSLILLLVVALLIVSEPSTRGKGEKCVLVLERIRSAAFVLSGPPEGERTGGAPPGQLPPAIRPWQAPEHPGRKVCVTGVVSGRREHRGRLSFVLEEGAAVDILVPEGKKEEAAAIRVGDIVVAEGTVAPRADRGWGLERKGLAAVLFLASGFLGLLVLESGRVLARNWYPLGAPPVPEAVMMFPLFCGLFGLPNLLLGLWETPVAPPQSDEALPLPRRRKLRGVLTGALAGGILGWYPGMTAGHGAVLARLIAGEDSEDEDASTREFLVSASAVTMANAFFNLVALFVILRARSGALHITQEVLGEGLVRWQSAPAVPAGFALLAVSAAVAALLACPLTLLLGKLVARLFGAVPYRRLLAAVVGLLLVMLWLFSGISGLAVAAVSSALGLVAPLAGVRRVHLMGAILLPVILYFTGATEGVMAFLGF